VGGYINHAIYWDNLCPPQKGKFSENSLLEKEINAKWGSLAKFIEEFNKMTVAI